MNDKQYSSVVMGVIIAIGIIVLYLLYNAITVNDGNYESKKIEYQEKCVNGMVNRSSSMGELCDCMKFGQAIAKYENPKIEFVQTICG